jgi:hypothetical protein
LVNVHHRDCVSFAVKITDHLLERSLLHVRGRFVAIDGKPSERTDVAYSALKRALRGKPSPTPEPEVSADPFCGENPTTPPLE